MPFERYSVLTGVLHRHFRDRPDNEGRWFHVNLEVDAPAGRYECAVDVGSPALADSVGCLFVMRPPKWLQRLRRLLTRRAPVGDRLEPGRRGGFRTDAAARAPDPGLR